MKTRCPNLARRTGQTLFSFCQLILRSQDQRINSVYAECLTLKCFLLVFVSFSMKPTYNPSKIRRARKFGFRKRNLTASGRKVVKNRRRKGRARLTASVARRFR